MATVLIMLEINCYVFNLCAYQHFRVVLKQRFLFQ